MKNILVFTILILISKVLVAETIDFNFNPPDSISFIQTLTNTKTIKTNDKISKIDEVQVKTLITILKNQSGYYLRETPITLNSKRDGKQFINPIFSFLSGFSITGDLDLNGRLINVYGYENIIEKARKSLSSEVVESLQLVANPETMVNKTKAEWNARISDFIGQRVIVGDMFSGEGKFPLPNGETLTFFSLVKVLDTLTYDGKKCVKIEFKNSSIPDSLAAFMGYSKNEIKKVFNGNINSNVSTKIEINGYGERIIDPATMLIYHEKKTRDIIMFDENADNGKRKIETIEKNIYNYKY